jgi:outer membrane protein assembly factor BamB
VRSKRRIPPPWLLLLLVVAVGSVIWMQLTDAVGDSGIANALSFLVLAFSGLGAWIWLVLFSAHAKGVRASIGLGTLAALIVASAIWRIDGFSGTLIPSFVLRSAAPRAFPASNDPSTGEGAAQVDLSTTTAADFPGFLGPRRDGTVSGVRLARSWSEHPPELLWKQPVGAGWSGFAVVNGVAVTLEQRGEFETVAAYDVLDGTQL